MILAYCVVGVFIVIVTAIVVWYICANRHEWCVKVKKRKVVKKRVRREALMEVFQPPPHQQTIDIGKENQHNKRVLFYMLYVAIILQITASLKHIEVETSNLDTTEQNIYATRHIYPCTWQYTALSQPIIITLHLPY